MQAPTAPVSDPRLEEHIQDWVHGRAPMLPGTRYGRAAILELQGEPIKQVPCLSIGINSTEALQVIGKIPVAQAWITCGSGSEYCLVCEVELNSGGRVYSRHSLRNPVQNDVFCIDKDQVSIHRDALRAHFAQPMFNSDAWSHQLITVGNSQKLGIGELNQLITKTLLSSEITRARAPKGTQAEFHELNKLSSL